MGKKIKIQDIEMPTDSMMWSMAFYIKTILTKNGNANAEALSDKFMEEYKRLVQEHENEDVYDLLRYYRLITEFKPALSTILKPGKEFDMCCDIVISSFNTPLDRVRKQVKEGKLPSKKKGPVIPGSNKSMNLLYHCTVCKQNFEIPPEIQEHLLNDDEKMELPKHCDKEMIIKIVRIQEEPPEEIAVKDDESDIKIYSAELLMGHIDSKEANVEYLDVTSVGIDIGSSTSHLVFSKLTLKRETSFFNISNRFNLANREIIYEGNIIFTPLIDRYTIDIKAIIKFCEEEYKKAGISTEMVDTGAVIVTGETAKKQNAAEIINRLSSEGGKFVSAVAGPNFEALLGAMGSGIVEQSRKNQRTILNVDVGGGTSNIAISSKGNVYSTSCINIGGRLLGIDKDFKIWRIDEPSVFLMKELNMNYKLGDVIPEKDVKTISREYAKALLEVMRGPATSKIAKELMMTEDLDFSIPIDDISFSGGVAEMIYGRDESHEEYNDIGKYLAKEINLLVEELGLSITEPENKIRATVIGAGAFSLSISGSTCYVDKDVVLPYNNIPVLPVNVKRKEFSLKNIEKEIKRSFKNYDMKEGEDIVALYFKEFIDHSDNILSILAKAIESSLPQSVAQKKPIILIFSMDIAKVLGIAIRRNTAIQNNLICLDELNLEAGDFIDIGAPLNSGKEAYPITVKSLVFNKNKDASNLLEVKEK
ncbi:MAG: ethanolamine ammonia-lyase reactivating factor EutA [Promethearchaeota archaeon]